MSDLTEVIHRLDRIIEIQSRQCELMARAIELLLDDDEADELLTYMDGTIADIPA